MDLLVSGDSRISAEQRQFIEAHAADGLFVSMISCWEVAQKASAGKLQLSMPVDAWLSEALVYPGIHLAGLTLKIAIESTRLPEPLHRDPADRIIIATARAMGCELMTFDEKILRYPHVKAAKGPP